MQDENSIELEKSGVSDQKQKILSTQCARVTELVLGLYKE